ncbi:MAG: DUF1351 domain-containing protein [Roseburia sp.]
MQEISVNVEQKNGVIGFNFDEIREKLEAEMQIYRSMVFTEDTKKEAKETVAELRKLKKSVEDKRKEVKASFMAPYTEFESMVKELNALIDEPITFISTQVDAFEKKRLDEKRELIKQLYEENIDGMEDYLPLDKIYNIRWENATATRKSIVDDISMRVLAAKTDLDTIRSMSSSYADKGIEAYKRTLSLPDAIQCINNYEKQAAEIKARQEAETAANAENVTKTETDCADPKIEFPSDTKEPVKFQKEPSSSEAAVYEIKADRFQIAQLEASMREFKIRFRRVQ